MALEPAPGTLEGHGVPQDRIPHNRTEDHQCRRRGALPSSVEFRSVVREPRTHRTAPGSGARQRRSQAVAEAAVGAMADHTCNSRHTQTAGQGHARTHKEIARGQALCTLT